MSVGDVYCLTRVTTVCYRGRQRRLRHFMSVGDVYCLTRVTQLCGTEAGKDDCVISCLLMVFIA